MTEMLAEDRLSDAHCYQNDTIPKILSAANIAYANIDANRIIQYVEGNAAQILGLNSNNDLLGMPITTFMEQFRIEDPQSGWIFSPQQITSMLDSSLDAPEAHRTSVVLFTKDGRRVRINSWYDGAKGCTMVLRDITVDSRYRHLFEIAMTAADAGFWAADFKSGQSTYSASILQRLTQAEQAKIKEKGLFALVHVEDLPNLKAEWENIVSEGRDFDIRYRVVLETDGMRWQRSIGRIDIAPDGTTLGATAFCMDISEEVEKANALHAEQAASKAQTEFLARMSHEIRTPLNAIIGMSDSLKDERLSEIVREVVTDIEDAAEGLHHLLSRTLDHAKLTSDKVAIHLESTDPRDILTTVSRLWKPQITSKGLEFQLIIDPKLPSSLRLDEFRLQQCLNNLLSNAAKFTKSGSIALFARQAEVKNKPHLVLAVKDTGIGMSPEEVSRVFDPFTQADTSIQREYGGTGLGMSITKNLCELMGGKIRVKTKPGGGATFALVIPINEDEDVAQETSTPIPDAQVADKKIETTIAPAITSADPRPNPVAVSMPAPTLMPVPDSSPEPSPASIQVQTPPKEEKPFEGLNVLCVEDNPINQKVVKRLIGKRVNQLHFAEHGREALNVLNTAHVDVVLMDIHMPIMDGIETTMEIRKSSEAYANVIIIALTADPDYQQRRICRNIGMDDTIAKPVKQEDILEAFDRTLSRFSERFGQPVALRA